MEKRVIEYEETGYNHKSKQIEQTITGFNKKADILNLDIESSI